MRRADVFCYLDTVQYKKNEWQNRNRIKTASGWQWLTVPVRYKFPQAINTVKINPMVNWRHKHRQALLTNYAKAPFFDYYFPLFETVFARDWEYLYQLNIELIERIKYALNLTCATVSASNFDVSDNPTDRLIDICKAAGADTYLSGRDGANYMDMAKFKQRGVGVLFQDFRHPVYAQRFGKFISHMSVIDLLFNHGPDSLRVMRGTHNWPGA